MFFKRSRISTVCLTAALSVLPALNVMYPVSVSDNLGIPSQQRKFIQLPDELLSNLLATSSFRIFSADTEYLPLQSDLTIAEYMIDSDREAEALYYLRQAARQADVIYASKRRKLGWPRQFTGSKKEVSFTVSENDPETVKKEWATYSELMIRYHLLSHDARDSKNEHYRKAVSIRERITPEYRRNVPVTVLNLVRYLDTNEPPRVERLDRFKSATAIFNSSYWSEYTRKKIIGAYLRTGETEKAVSLYKSTHDSNPGFLPPVARGRFHILTSAFETAADVLKDRYIEIEFTRRKNWVEFREISLLQVRLDILLNQHEAADSRLKKLISSTESILHSTDLPAEQRTYFEEEKNLFRLKRLALRFTELSPASLENEFNRIENREIFSDNYRIYYRLMAESSGLLPYSKEFWNNRELKIPAYYAAAVSFHRSENNDSVLNLKSYNEKDIYLKQALPALRKLKTEGSVEVDRAKYFFELNSDWVRLNTGLHTEIDAGRAYDRLIVSYFNRGIRDSADRNDLSVLFSLAQLYHTWQSQIRFPAAGFTENNRVTPINWLRKMVMATPGPAAYPALKQTGKLDCVSEKICISIYPAESLTLLIKSSKDGIELSSVRTGRSDLKELAIQFYAAVKSDFKNSALRKFDNLFKADSVFNTTEEMQGSRIQLNLYLTARYLPWEALETASGRLSDIYRVSRALPLNSLSEVEECPNCSAESPHHLLAVGRENSSFLLPFSSPTDEIDDIETIFGRKSIIRNGETVIRRLISAASSETGNILHIGGGIGSDSNGSVLEWADSDEMPSLRGIRYMPGMTHVSISGQNVSDLLLKESEVWNLFLQFLQKKGVRTVISTLAPPELEIRQSFFFDFYYRLEHRRHSPAKAYFAAIKRSKKRFSGSIAPYLLVFYENSR